MEARRILLASAVGLVFGLQSWKLAEFGFGAAMPWYGPAWVVFSHVMLGFTVGATSRCAWGWKRGFVLGLVFSVPSALASHVVLCIAAIAEGLAVGPVMALIADSVFLEKPRVNVGASSEIAQRLAAAKESLDALDAQRAQGGNADLGNAAEERIIWRELLDLELQDLDEHRTER